MKTDQAICVATIMAAVTVSMIVAQVDYYPPMDTSTEPINHKEVKCLGKVEFTTHPNSDPF